MTLLSWPNNAFLLTDFDGARGSLKHESSLSSSLFLSAGFMSHHYLPLSLSLCGQESPLSPYLFLSVGSWVITISLSLSLCGVVSHHYLPLSFPLWCLLLLSAHFICPGSPSSSYPPSYPHCVNAKLPRYLSATQNSPKVISVFTLPLHWGWYGLKPGWRPSYWGIGRARRVMRVSLESSL